MISYAENIDGIDVQIEWDISTESYSVLATDYEAESMAFRLVPVEEFPDDIHSLAVEMAKEAKESSEHE